MTTSMSPTATSHDADLVHAVLAGNRDAFGQIVSRYQSLICSLAYSATGSLVQSEDLAQETFVAAWKQLPGLREPEKLRSWLCGIARNLINNSLRKQGREPSHAAESLDEISANRSPEPLPVERMISNEEQAILWRSLERIPETYREPLVLFYREHQSVEAVAEKLELSQDTVHQRLSRGRKLLAEEVAAFVEGALSRTNPGKTFTLGVMALLPLTLATSAKAATLGAAAKTATAAKTASLLGLGSVLLNVFGVFIGPWIGYRAAMATATSDAHRQAVKKFHFGMFWRIGLGIVVLGLFNWAMFALFFQSHPALVAVTVSLALFAYACETTVFCIRQVKILRQLMTENQPQVHALQAQFGWEYRSKRELLGLPFVHVRMRTTDGPRGAVKAWIAVGGSAIGGLFAFGGIAVAPIALGGVAVGIISWGGLALGIITIAGMSIGVWADGGLAVGWQAFGGCAFAWNAAMGGYAAAHEFALGGVAHAAQFNNELAKQFIHDSRFFRIAEALSRYMGLMNLIWIAPLLLWWRKATKRKA